ncbi:hypothetical protein ACSV5M_01325 [Cellvibrio sp. ARAG 10.3]|uniref:hypothetical protein n=1 Tax=Cellvibrio sp. ARAG 10.3 TaxID=3451358 RepID=UPI003F469E52
MKIQSVWLLHHKASLAPDSTENLDGSTFMLGVGVVPASNMREALTKFDSYLESRKMEIMELWKCEQWDPKNFIGDSLENRQINAAAGKALESDRIHYTCGISSEALDCEED